MAESPPESTVESTSDKRPDSASSDRESEAADTEKTSATLEEAARYRIQVGSYTMKENADYMVRDLSKLSFTAQIVEAVVNGKTYYRVFVGDALSPDEAQVLLARLQDKGIGGYLSPQP
ncbi:MAG TPA: SPOR domain-containing protein [Spirochaetia bacterium]|nr:SPOR domain-containing protein [Spirochaetia bacterium]